MYVSLKSYVLVHFAYLRLPSDHRRPAGLGPEPSPGLLDASRRNASFAAEIAVDTGAVITT